MRLLFPGVLLAASVATAQSSIQTKDPEAVEGAAQLSPQAAYDEASRPVDIVHRAVANWSEAEQAALSVAVEKAKTACVARRPDQYTGEDLLAYARLCAFAQMWKPVQQAGTAYLIAESAATPEQKLKGFPNLSMAFDYVIQASLHLQNPINAYGTAQTMLRRVAYDDLVSEATNGVVRYLQLVQTGEALTLLEQRQPVLLAMLKARGPGPVSAGAQEKGTVEAADPVTPSVRSPLSVHEIYADAIQLPALQQFARQPARAASSFAELEAALPQNLSADDGILIGTLQRQYGLLGAPLPEMDASASLSEPSRSRAPDLSRKDAGAQAFLLFPYWCAQCVAMNPKFNDARKALKAEGVDFYALLAEANPPPGATPVVKASTKTGSRSGRSGSAGAAHVEIQAGTGRSAADQLMGTATLLVPPALLDTFAATDFPLLIATDGCGMVRYLGVAPDNVLTDGGLIYQVVDRVKQQWPVTTLTAADGTAGKQRRCGLAMQR